MQKILSTYLFVSRKLTHELLAQISEHGFSGLEVFCSRAHFDYGSKQEIQALKSALEANRMTLSSLHAPTSKDLSATRESGTPLSICEVERVRRIEAMDEFKRAIDVSEELPFSTHGAAHGRVARNGRPTQTRCGVQFTGASGAACASCWSDAGRGKYHQRNGRSCVLAGVCG